MAVPRSRADVDPNFERQVRALAADAAFNGAALARGDAPRWCRPAEAGSSAAWAGDPADYEALGAPFTRAGPNQAFVEAVTDPEDPGTSGDVILTTTMIDYLASLERAYRARLALGRPRALLLAAGRLQGHGSPEGPFVQCALEYARRVARQSKGEDT